MTLAEIEALTTELARAREELKTCLDRGEAECEAVRRHYRPMLKRRADAVNERRAALEAAIREHPDLFKRPKTRTWAAIRVGLMKQKGKITVADEAATIAHIQRYYPAQAKSAVKVTRKFVRSAVSAFTADMLKKCGIAVGDDTDDVVIKPVDGQLEKLVTAWLEDAEDAK